MRVYEFTLVLTSPEQSEEDANALYEAGCWDGSISTIDNVTRIEFHRRAENLEDALRSAIHDVQATDFQVAHVIIEPESLVQAS